WYDDGAGTLAVLLASASDVDDLVPTLVALQIEWNKIRTRMRASGLGRDGTPGPTTPDCARELGGSQEDWERVSQAWGGRVLERVDLIGGEGMAVRLGMLGGTNTGYSRMTRRWWAPVSAELVAESLAERPLYFVSSNTHSLANIATGTARELEDELVAFVET